MRIEGQGFLVAGGASGLGEATARLLVSRGASVVVADIDQARGTAVAQSLGERARFIALDVADERGARAAAELVASTFGSLRGVVNAAGAVHGERILSRKGTHSLAALRRMIDVNLVGAFNVACAAAEVMSRAAPTVSGERGVIVNTASVAAFDGQVGQAAYAGAKGGVVSMTLPLARDLAEWGIRVMTIAPGIFDTPLLAATLQPFMPPAAPSAASVWLGAAPAAAPAIPDALKAEIGRMAPFPPRLGRPEEFAALAVSVIENEMLNGEVIRLDGAIRMPPK